MITGERALLITKEEPNMICKKLASFKPMEFAKTGFVSNTTITLKVINNLFRKMINHLKTFQDLWNLNLDNLAYLPV